MNILFNLGDLLELGSNLFIIVVMIDWALGFRKVTLDFSGNRCITLRKKDVTIQNVTNIMSLKYFKGGQIPPEIRGEIIFKLSPNYD